MFKFEDYPEIKKMHELDAKLERRSTHLQFKLERSGDNEKLDKMFDEEMKKWDNFENNEYAKVIFDTFYKKIPYLINKKTNKKEKWSDVIGNDFDKIPFNERGELVTIVEGYSLYLFPPEYYNTIDDNEILRLDSVKRDVKHQGYKNPTKEQISQLYRKYYQRDPFDIDLYFPYIP